MTKLQKQAKDMLTGFMMELEFVNSYKPKDHPYYDSSIEKILFNSVHSARYIIDTNGYLTGVRLTFDFMDGIEVHILTVDTEDRILYNAMGSRDIFVPISPSLAAALTEYVRKHIGFNPDSERESPYEDDFEEDEDEEPEYIMDSIDLSLIPVDELEAPPDPMGDD